MNMENKRQKNQPPPQLRLLHALEQAVRENHQDGKSGLHENCPMILTLIRHYVGPNGEFKNLNQKIH